MVLLTEVSELLIKMNWCIFLIPCTRRHTEAKTVRICNAQLCNIQELVSHGHSEVHTVELYSQVNLLSVEDGAFDWSLHVSGH